jgi:hypothetical protein
LKHRKTWILAGLWLAPAAPAPAADATWQSASAVAAVTRRVDPLDANAIECPAGSWCDPFPIDAAIWTDHRSTAAGVHEASRYGCDPGVDESGPENVYQLDLEVTTVVRASIDSPQFVDVDVQLLSGLGPGGCRARGDSRVEVVLPPGRYWLAVDSYVDRHGEVMAGDYALSVEQKPLPSGRCAMASQLQEMYWPSCADGLDCRKTEVDGREGVFAQLPAVGPVALEAHLATTADFEWPNTSTDGLDAHYRATARASGYAMARKEPWAPSPTGGVYARGSTGAPLPPLAEAWYVNMVWKDKPAPGQRMILYNPANGRAIVAAAGYETGPRSNEALGGASEEAHHALGVGHLGELVMGFALDQSLPYGPVDCGS